VRGAWARVGFEAIEAGPVAEPRVGDQVRVRAWLQLGPLTPDDVAVEFYPGRVDTGGQLIDAKATRMWPVGPAGDTRVLFEAAATSCGRSGLHGYTARVLPHHPDLTTPFLPGLIAWASSQTTISAAG
jgi:glycogen phosphorylase